MNDRNRKRKQARTGIYQDSNVDCSDLHDASKLCMRHIDWVQLERFFEKERILNPPPHPLANPAAAVFTSILASPFIIVSYNLYHTDHPVIFYGLAGILLSVLLVEMARVWWKRKYGVLPNYLVKRLAVYTGLAEPHSKSSSNSEPVPQLSHDGKVELRRFLQRFIESRVAIKYSDFLVVNGLVK